MSQPDWSWLFYKINKKLFLRMAKSNQVRTGEICMRAYPLALGLIVQPGLCPNTKNTYPEKLSELLSDF
jgi:hypothetical protein